jgi:hypothetical protein
MAANLGVPRSQPIERTVYDYKHAPWNRIRAHLSSTDWSSIDSSHVDFATAEITRIILRALDLFVPKRQVFDSNPTHPWLNDRCLELIRAKRSAEGTHQFPEVAAACSAGILMEFHKYIGDAKRKLKKLRRGSKAWWRYSN